MIPLAHDFSGETVLVFGGGRVGARKARRFAREATVVVLSPSFADVDFGNADLVRASPEPDDVGEWVDWFNPVLVVAATDDDEVNDAAAEAARAAGALANRADESGERAFGDVAVPATVDDDPVSVAVSTGGESPALAKYLRERIEAEVAGAGGMAALTSDLRDELKEADVPSEDRRTAIRRVVREPSVWKALRTGDSNARREAERVLADVLGSRWSP